MSTISYPKIWVSGEILTAADLNAEFAAVNGITGITGSQISAAANIAGTQLAVGAAVNAFQSAALNLVLTASTVETTIVTLPSITTRGGRVILFGSSGVFLSATAGAQLTWKVYRDASIVQTIVTTAGTTTGTVNIPLALPLFSEAPAAGSYVYKITTQTNTTSATINNTAQGTAYVLELS